MALISEEYKKLNEELHKTNREYGVSGHLYIEDVLMLSNIVNSQDILDYGCGKSTLAMNLPFRIKQYDPAILKHSLPPKSADIVVCTDVMEHVEPECINSVLDDITALANKAAYFIISTVPAKKTLADGRNAHISLLPAREWVEKIWQRMPIVSYMQNGSNIKIICVR